MSECMDCCKGHCDRWDHLLETVNHQANGLDERVLLHPNEIVLTIKVLYGVPVIGVGVGDEVPRCACGGMFHPIPAGDGTMLCDCCGAAWDFGDGPNSKSGPSPDEEVGRTLTEVLLARRRVGRTDWRPSEDDVKVMVHG